MSLLLINVGNTNTVAARAVGVDGRLLGPPEQLLSMSSRADLDELAGAVGGCRRDDEVAAVTSVVPCVTDALREIMPDLRSVDHTWTFPFGVAIHGSESVGADRWCNVAAAVHAGMQDAIVVDAGTATTIDVLHEGVFVGGLIAPGMKFAAQKLQEEAARLWPVEFTPRSLRPGRDTDEALAIGAYQVGVNGVIKTVEGLLEEYPRARTVLTGGLASHLQRPDWLVDPAWTLRGLAALVLEAG